MKKKKTKTKRTTVLLLPKGRSDWKRIQATTEEEIERQKAEDDAEPDELSDVTVKVFRLPLSKRQSAEFKRYMTSETMTRRGLIEITPGVIGGRPRIAGTRLGIGHILLALSNGHSVDEVRKMFCTSEPLTREQVYAALEYAGYHLNGMKHITL